MSDAWVSIHGRGVTNPAPTQPGTIAVPEELAWRASTWLRVLERIILSGEVKEEVAADQAAWFALLTEAPNA